MDYRSCFKKRIWDTVNVIEIDEVIDIGVTKPIRCKLENGAIGVVKYQNNDFCDAVLINEIVGNSIADVIELSIPRYGICELAGCVIDHANNTEEITCDNSGKAFFSEFMSNTVPATDRFLAASNVHESERLILFDHIVKNYDRHNGNFLCEVSCARRVYFYDCSHLFYKSGDRHSMPIDREYELTENAVLDTSILQSNCDLYGTICRTMGFDEERLYSEAKRIKSILTDDLLEFVFESIPSDWFEKSTRQRTDALFTAICKRVDKLDDICDMIMKERRN